MEKMKNHTRRKIYSWLLVIAMVFSIIQPMPGSVKEASAQEPGSIPEPTEVADTQVRVQFNGNPSEKVSLYYGTGETEQDAPSSVDVDKVDDDWGPVTLPRAVRRGYTFTGWYTQPGNGDYVGDPGDTYIPDSSVQGGNIVELWAQWEPVQFKESSLEVLSKENIQGTYVNLVYDGTVKTPTVTVYDENDIELTEGEDFELMYKASPEDQLEVAQGQDPIEYYPYGLVGDGTNGGKDGVVYGYKDAVEDAVIYIKGINDYAEADMIEGEFTIQKRNVTIIPTQEDGEMFAPTPEPPEQVVYKYDLDVEGLTDTYINRYMADTIAILDDGRKVFIDPNKTPTDDGYIKELLSRESAYSTEVGEYKYDISGFEAEPDLSRNFEFDIDQAAAYKILPYSFTGKEDHFHVQFQKEDGDYANTISYKYNGVERTPVIRVIKLRDNAGQLLVSADILEEGVDYTIEEEGSKGTEIGDYTVTIKGIGNYSGTLTADWHITKKELTIAKYQFQLDGKNVSINDDANHTVNQSDDIIYDGKEHAVSIIPVDPEDNTGTVNDIEVLYSLEEDGTYTNVIPTFKNAGTYKVYYKVKSTNHYDAETIVGFVTFSIAKKPVTIKVKSATKIYGDDDPVYEFSSSKLVTGETIDPAKFRTAVRRYGEPIIDISSHEFESAMARTTWINNYEQVGTYYLTIDTDDTDGLGKLYPNYEFEDKSQDDTSNYHAKLTIKKKPIKVVADSQTKKYYEALPANYSYSYKIYVTSKDEEGNNVDTLIAAPFDTTVNNLPGLPFGDTLTGALVCMDKQPAPQEIDAETAVGEYDITKGDLAGSNYQITYVKSKMSVTPIDISSLPLTGTDADRLSVQFVEQYNEQYTESYTSVFPYDDAYHSPIFNIAYTVEGGDLDTEHLLAERTDYTLSGDTRKKDMGYYEVTIKGKGNYTGSITRRWLIAIPANVTGSKTADYSGRALTFESFAESGKLKFPEGSIVRYNTIYFAPDATDSDIQQGLPELSSGADEDLGFDYKYLPEGGDTYYNDETAPELKYAGTYVVYYKVTPVDDEGQPVPDKTLYFSFKYKINKKKVVLVPADKVMTYGKTAPTYTIRAVAYDDSTNYNDEATILSLQGEPSALYTSDKITEYAVVTPAPENNMPLDVGSYELTVREKTAAELQADAEAAAANDQGDATEADPRAAFSNNYNVYDAGEVQTLRSCPGTLTVVKTDFEGDVEEIINQFNVPNDQGVYPIPTTVPIASKATGTQTVTYLKDVMTSQYALGMGFKNPVYLKEDPEHQDEFVPLDPIVYSGDTTIIDEDTVTIAEDGTISFQLAANAKAGKEVTLKITVDTKNYRPVVVPVTIKTKKNAAAIEVKHVEEPNPAPVFSKVYDGDPIPIVNDDQEYKNYFDITGMKYDASNAVNSGYVYPGSTGYTEDQYNALGYNINFKYYTYDAQTENHIGTLLDSVPKDAGKYVIVATLEESPEYESARASFVYEITKKPITVSLNGISADKVYDGTAVANIPDVEVVAPDTNTAGQPVKGESFKITGLTGKYKIIDNVEYVDDKHVSYSGTNPVAKLVKVNNPFAEGADIQGYNYQIVKLNDNSKIDIVDGKSLKNYTITLDDEGLCGIISPKELTIKIPAIEDKTYDGYATATIPNINVSDATPAPQGEGQEGGQAAEDITVTGITGETFTVAFTGTYQAVNTIPAKDVLLNSNGEVIAKPVNVTTWSISAPSQSVAVTNDNKLVDYKLSFDESDLKGKINKKTVTINVASPYDNEHPRVYNGTADVAFADIVVPASATQEGGPQTGVAGESFRISGLTGEFQNSAEGVEDAKDVVLDAQGAPAAKVIKVNNPYAATTPSESIQGYSVTSTSEDAIYHAVAISGITPRNYNIVFNDTGLTGVITKKPIAVTLYDSQNRPEPVAEKIYDGTDVASIDDYMVEDANDATAANKAVKGEAFKITGLKGRYQPKEIGEQTTIAGKDVYYIGDTAVDKDITFINPYAENLSEENRALAGSYAIDVTNSNATLETAAEGSVPKLTNYDITFDGRNLEGKIIKKAITIIPPSPEPRVYNGTANATIANIEVPATATTEGGVETGIEGEFFTIKNLSGTYQDTKINEGQPDERVICAGKDVFLDDFDKESAKKVKLVRNEGQVSYGVDVPERSNFDKNNYLIEFDEANLKGIINKKPIEIKIPDPIAKTYDGTADVTLADIVVPAMAEEGQLQTGITNESFIISGLKGTYQDIIEDGVVKVKGKDVGTKNINIIDPYDPTVSFTQIGGYTVTSIGPNDINIVDSRRYVLQNYNIIFNVGEGDNHLKGVIKKKDINVVLPELADREYDGTDIAKFADINIAADNSAATANKAVKGEAFTLKGLTGIYQPKVLNEGQENEERIAGKDVYLVGTTPTEKTVKYLHPYTDYTNAELDLADAYKTFTIVAAEGSAVDLKDGALVNYNLIFPENREVTGKIVPKALVFNITAEDKEYDGKTDAKLNIAFDENYKPVGTEGFNVEAFNDKFVGTFDSKNVARDESGEVTTVPVTVSLKENATIDDPQNPDIDENDGTIASNYKIQVASANFDATQESGYAKVEAKILPKEVYLVTEIADKEYDGTTDATVTSAEIYHYEPAPTPVADPGSDPEPGSGQEVAATATPVAVPGTGVVVGEGDNAKEEKIRIKINSAEFASKDVAYTTEGENTVVASQPVTVECEADPYSITGTDINNYSIVYGYEEGNAGTEPTPITEPAFTGSAKILPKELTASYTVADKLYDGTDAAVVTATVETGIDNEGLVIAGTGLTGKFVSKNVGENIKAEVTADKANITVTAAAETETTPGNYNITYPEVSETGANITKRNVKITAVANPATVKYDALDTVAFSAKVEYQKDATSPDVYALIADIAGYAGDEINTRNIEVGYAAEGDKLPSGTPYVVEVKDQDAIATTYTNYNITFVTGTETVNKADGPAAPSEDIVTVVRPVDETTANGEVAIATEAPTTLEYRYKVSQSDWTTWNAVAADGKITGLKVTTLQLRVAETTTHNAGAALDVDIAAKETQAAPTTVVAHKTTAANVADGSITGLTATMEYSTNGTTWTAVGEEQTEVTELASGTEVSVRYKETNDKRPGTAWTATIGVKTNMATPDVSDITMVKASSDKVNDGKMIVPSTKTGLEYSIDNGTTWKDVVPTDVTGLPVGAVLVRTKTTNVEEYNPSEAVKLIVGNLEDDKTAAKKAIDDEAAAIKEQINATDLPDLTADQITTYKNAVDTAVTNAKAAIDAATSVSAVAEKKTAGISAIDEVLTTAKATDAAEALAKAKTAAKNAVDGAANFAKTTIGALTNLTLAEKIALAGAIANNNDNTTIAGKGKADIDAATTVSAVTTVKEDTISKISEAVVDAKKADLAAAIAAAKQDVATAKSTANDTISGFAPILTNDEINAYKGQVGNIEDSFTAKVDAITDPAKLSDVATYKTNATDAISDVVTTADSAYLRKAKSDSKQVITDEVTSAKAAIEQLNTLSDAEKTPYNNAIDEAATTGNNAIDAVATSDKLDDIVTAKLNAVAAIDDIVDNAKAADALKKAKQDATATVNTAKDSAIEAINALDDLSADEKAGFINSISKENDDNAIVNVALKSIQEADTPAKAETAGNNAKTAIEEVVNNAKAKELDNVKKAAEAAINAAITDATAKINALTNLSADDKKSATDGIGNKDAANSIAGKAIKAIGEATKVADAKKNGDDCVKAIADEIAKAVKSDLDNAKAKAKSDVQASQEAAKKAIDATEGLTAKEKSSYKALIDSNAEAAIKAIDKITDPEAIADIAEEVTNTNTVIAKAKDDSSLDAAKNIAANSIKSEADKAIESINGMKYLTNDQKKEFRDKVSAVDAEKAVENAKTAAEANSSADTAKAKIKSALDDATAANLTNAKNDAIKAISAKGDEAADIINNCDKLTEEESEKYQNDIDKAEDDAEKAINDITDPAKIDDVAAKKDEAVAAIDKIAKEATTFNTVPDQAAVKVTESAGADGTIEGLTDGMEYSVDGGNTWTKVEKDQTSLTGLKPGTVQIRYAATDDKVAGKIITVTIPEKQIVPTTAPTQVPQATTAPVTGTVTDPNAPTPNPLKASQISALSLNKGLKVSQTGKRINVAWGKVDGAATYKVFAQYCGKKFAKKANATVKAGKAAKATIKKINGKKLDLKKNYKVVVKAYDSKGKVIGSTIDAHIVGKNNKKFSNVKSVSVFESKTSIAVGKTYQIDAETELVDDSKEPLSNKHAKEFRYASSNPAIATVNSSGKITAVAQGTCTVYVYARNGYAKTVDVTVY